jgi:DNA modification methylase
MDYRLIQGDCLDVLPGLGGIDAVITDPPYGINGGSGHINRERGKGNYTGEFEDTREYIADVIVPIIKRLISMCGCVILTPGNKNFDLYPRPDSFGCYYQPAAAGLQVFGNLDAQPIFYYGKNASKKNMGVPCSYQLTEAPEANGHPCVKPIKAWTKLILNNTLPGQTVLDPFMGSGTTGVGCRTTGRRFIGVELDERYFKIAERRIAQAQPPLFVVDATPQPEPSQAAMFGD